MPTHSASSDKSGIDQVKEHLLAIRDDFASLATATANLTARKAKSEARRAGEFAEDAAAQAATYRDAVIDKVKDHPLAAIGIAMLAGAVLSSMGRRR